MAKRPGEFSVLNVADQSWCHPPGMVCDEIGNGAAERRVVALVSKQFAQEESVLRPADSGAHNPAEMQLSIGAVGPDQQCSHAVVVSADAGQPAADDKRVAPPQRCLDPLR